MLLLDVLFRYSTITLLLLLAVFAIRDGKFSGPSKYAVFVTITVAAMLFSTAPPELSLPRIPYMIAHSIDATNIAFVWWFGLSILNTDFRLGRLEWAGFLIYTAPVFMYRLWEIGLIPSYPAEMGIFIKLMVFLMMGHLVYVALKGRADDLIEKRRALRLNFVYALCAATALIILAETILLDRYNAELTILRAFIILVVTAWGFFWLTKFHPEKMSFKPVKTISVKPPCLDPRDQAMHDKLLEAMEQEKIYLEPNLSIRTLAEKLKTPEHRLRVLINQGLGYQNFSTFVNGYRIEAVKTAFADPANTRIPVLTIALDAGYGSLAPFNRAFLKVVGMTPSAYRQGLLKKNP